MTLNRFVISALVLCLGAAGPVAAKANGLPSGMPQHYGQQDRGGWDAPPRELREMQQRGFHDGIIGAQRDFDNHRRPDPNNRDEYRRPTVPYDQREAYRDGFRRGYERGVAHLQGGYQQPLPPPGRDIHDQDRGGGDYGNNRGPGNEMRRKGFRDGVEGALRDLDNNRRPDPNNRDEYRYPSVPGELREVYREGFRRGYDKAMTQITGDWGRGPGPGSEIRRRGFRDGMQGALRDLDNNRRPDPNNRDEYRRPNNVPYELQEQYRDGFRRGYDVGMAQLTGEPR